MTAYMEFIFAALIGLNSGVLIWLCFERDRLHNRIERLKRRTYLMLLDLKFEKLEVEK